MSGASAPIRSLLERARLIPVLRARTESELRSQLERVLDAGIDLVEITATSPGWERVLAETAALPGIVVGAGTILSESRAFAAAAAGAQFLVAPCAVPAVRGAVDVPLIEGAFTPSEVLKAAGPDRIVKLFPASTGGPSHLRALLDVAPGTDILPTGGIAPLDALSWIQAGAIAVGLGSGLTQLAVSEIRALQRQLQAVKQ